jgi:hypothetical protein
VAFDWNYFLTLGGAFVAVNANVTIRASASEFA